MRRLHGGPPEGFHTVDGNRSLENCTRTNG
ncbi:protein of unknown function (plasmid) [Azospirillum baldaniorum]|uniref:Uncharacterized protein n=1 Tax=Azospirillum baldaniorum TaxID=1064539 RepID=A0A9P1NP96_9PROT|nr:protein of unknown function [Azospirillum baldaniorum]